MSDHTPGQTPVESPRAHLLISEQAVQTLQALGVTADELTERLIARMALMILDTKHRGDEDHYRQTVEDRLKEEILTQTRQKIKEVADEVVKRTITSELLENVLIQQTSTFGETRGPAQTFKEFIVHRAETYLTGRVNSSGDEVPPSSHYYKDATPRVAALLQKALTREVERVVAEGLLSTQRLVTDELLRVVNNATGKLQGALERTAQTMGARTPDELKKVPKHPRGPEVSADSGGDSPA